ncbi:hypothetical protein E4U57_005640 [Claviceps arundinis]|uniref:Uncharacterized protein n=1 Tax=Claviceps arundinis TaxID=1623583 RepID=A0ABQ7PJH3_9HYPO|nr:hypothetical protein E4U57_005640 [Claviceps arundinis]
MCWRRHPQALTSSGRSGHTSADPVASTLYCPLSVLPPVTVVFPPLGLLCCAQCSRRQNRPTSPANSSFPRPHILSIKATININQATLQSVFEPFHSVLSPRRCPGALPWLRLEPPSMGSRTAIGRTANGLNEAILAPITLFMSQRLLIILSRP